MSFGAIAVTVGTAAVGAAVGSTVSNVMNKKKGSGGSGGYTTQTMPQYSWNEGFRQQQADYISGGLQRMQEGKYPAYYEKLEPTIKKGMTDSLYQTFYGQPGNRTGTIQDAMSIGAMTGLKGKLAGAPANKQLMDYSNKSTAIDQYMAQLGVSVMSQGEQNYLQAAQGMPSGPNAQNVPWSNAGTAGDTSLGDAVGTAVGTGVSDWMGGWNWGNKAGTYNNYGITPGNTGMTGFDWNRTAASTPYQPYTSGTLANRAASQYSF